MDWGLGLRSVAGVKRPANSFGAEVVQAALPFAEAKEFAVNRKKEIMAGDCLYSHPHRRPSSNNHSIVCPQPPVNTRHEHRRQCHDLTAAAVSNTAINTIATRIAPLPPTRGGFQAVVRLRPPVSDHEIVVVAKSFFA